MTLDVWPISLDVPAAVLADLRATLSDDELERASRFRFRRDAERFTAGRGLMRRILGEYLDVDSTSLRFAYGPAGKPSLEDHPDLGFNLAHSGGQGLLAVAGDAAVGVDIEVSADARGACEDIAPTYFAPAEVEELEALLATERSEAFLRCWTRKESYVKALGDGLQMPLDDFTVSFGPHDPPRLRWCRRPEEVGRWSLVDLSHLTGGATAAACVEGEVAAIRAHRQALP